MFGLGRIASAIEKAVTRIDRLLDVAGKMLEHLDRIRQCIEHDSSAPPEEVADGAGGTDGA